MSRPRAAVAAVVVASASVLAGCSSRNYPASPVPAVLNDREAVRLAELYLNGATPAASPRDVVSVESTGDGHVVGFRTVFMETEQPPRQSRLVLVKHDGNVREITFVEGD